MRVQRTTAFVDLSLFTAYTVEHGDAAAAQVLGSFRTLARQIASRRSVRVAKWLGDGAMLVSQDASAAVAGALEMQRRAGEACGQLALRAGVASGPVMLFEGDDYLGVSVNLAARLCDHARPHEVLASPEIAEHLPAWAVGREDGTRDLKGFAEPAPVLVLDVRSPDGDAVIDPVCGLTLDHAAAVGLRRAGAARVVGFCDDSCEAEWLATRELPRAI